MSRKGLAVLVEAESLRHEESLAGLEETLRDEGESRRGAGQVCGRDPWHRVVNVEASGPSAAPGAMLDVEIVEATPHSLIGERIVEGGAAQPRPEIRVAAVKPGGRSADEQERNAAFATRARDPLRVI